MLNIKLNVRQGIHFRHFRFLQNSITPQTGNTSLSQNAGAVWGDRHCPLRLFHVKLKEFSRAKKTGIPLQETRQRKANP
jgi:hypothetical protein